MWDTFTQKVGVLKYSQKFEMEEWRVPYTGWWWKVHTNYADVGHSTRACQSPHRCYYYHRCYFKRKDEKGNAWL